MFRGVATYLFAYLFSASQPLTARQSIIISPNYKMSFKGVDISLADFQDSQNNPCCSAMLKTVILIGGPSKGKTK